MKSWIPTILVLTSLKAFAQSSPEPAHEPAEAPPTPPAMVVNESGVEAAKGIRAAAVNPDLYEIGDLSDEEQYYVELINRARKNPPVEGQWLVNLMDPDVLSSLNSFSVNLTQVLEDPAYGFNQYTEVQPLAPNAKLTIASRLHSEEMLEHTYQAHENLAGETATQRITAQNYNWHRNGENVFSSARSVVHGHAGFQIDWGNGPGGIQSPPGHRRTIHNGAYREIGVGVVEIEGRKTNVHPPGDPLNPEDPENPGVGTDPRFRNVGPQLVTQVFAEEQNANPFVTGVAYYDVNGNGYYEPGEGIGNVNVAIDVVDTYAVTINPGGYAVPLPGNGDYTATFTLDGQATPIPFTVSGNLNTKVDFTPTYTPPAVSGPTQALLDSPTAYSISPLPGATEYQFQQSELAEITGTEGAENGLGTFDVIISEAPQDYTVRVTNKRASGSYAFRLAHPATEDQFLVYKSTLRPRAGAMLTFFSQLAWAFENEIARVEVSTDEGSTWTSIWSQAGTTPLSALDDPQPSPSPAETSFNRRDVSLAAYEGQDIRLRFQYDFTSGSIWIGNDNSTGTGWYFDNIQFTNVDALGDVSTTDLGTQRSFNFTATSESTYTLQARAKVSDRWFPWGPTLNVLGSTSVVVAPTVGDTSITLSGNTAILAFTVTGSNPTIKLLSAPDPAGPWTEVAGATITPQGGGSYSTQVSTATYDERYYLISAR